MLFQWSFFFWNIFRKSHQCFSVYHSTWCDYHYMCTFCSAHTGYVYASGLQYTFIIVHWYSTIHHRTRGLLSTMPVKVVIITQWEFYLREEQIPTHVTRWVVCRSYICIVECVHTWTCIPLNREQTGFVVSKPWLCHVLSLLMEIIQLQGYYKLYIIGSVHYNEMDSIVHASVIHACIYTGISSI